jgi:predicted alpha-1,2-mannosidase
MIGNPAITVIADAYIKGIRSYDAEKAYDSCKQASEKFSGSRKSISETLEYSYSDWCLSRFAGALGHSEEAGQYYQKSLRYRDLFNKDIKWFQPKNDDGSWMTYPRDGRLTQDFGCVESNPYQQGWFVPHDWDYFVDLLGGKEAACQDLKNMFAKTPHTYPWNDYYNHANEPVHSIPYLFNLLGYPSLTQYWTRDICENAYHDSVEGLVGNEDEGQMSAWYVLSSIGLYQVCPGNPVFEITSPVFRNVKINLPDGKVFEINAVNNSIANRYIKSASLNGKPLQTMEISYDQIMAGGRLDLQMEL